MVDLRKGLSDAWYSLTGGFESGFNRMLRGLSDSITTFNGNLIKSVSSNAAYYWKMYNGQTANYGETDGPSMGGYGPGWLAEQKKKNAAWKAAQAKLKTSADFKRGAGGMLASADKYGDAADQIPKPKPKTGWGVGTPPDLGGQSESDKAKKRAAREQLRREKDAINDVAKAYEYKAQAAKKAAQITIEGAKNELEKLKDVRDSLKDKFASVQDEFVSLGIINDPLGPMIKRFEQLIDIAGKSKTIVADARKSFNASIGAAKTANSAAMSARSKSELLSGLDGVVPTKGGSLETGPLGARIAQNALTMQKKWGDRIGKVFYHSCDRLADITVNGATKAFSRFMGPGKGRDTAARTMAGFKRAGIGFAATAGMVYSPGDIVYSGATRKNSAGHVQIIGPDGRFLDQYGAHKKPTTRPAWVVRPDGNNAKGTRFGSSGGYGGASGEGGDFPAFDLKVLNGSLSKIGAIDSAWGKGVKSGEGTAARFAFQTALASKEYQGQLKAMAAQAGVTFPQLVRMFRDFANKADVDLNRVKAVDAVTDSLKELDKARRAIGQDKNPFASILGEFEAGGKYAAAPERKLALLDAQRKLSVDQTTQATKEATHAEREKISVLSVAGRALNAYTIKTGQYEIALEKEQARFDVWKRPEITGLLEEAKVYDKLGGSILKVGKALAANPFVAAPGASARMLTQGNGLKGRAAGLFAGANKQAGIILDAQDKSAEYARAWGRTKADLEANDALDAQIAALKEEGSILKNLTLSETERADKIERSNFLLDKQSGLLKLNHSAADALRLATGYADKSDFIKKLQRQNEDEKGYRSSFEEATRAVKLAQGLQDITLKFPGYGPQQEKELALFEKRQELLTEMEKRGKNTSFADVNFFGKMADFEKVFDAQSALKSAGAVRSILDEAAEAVATFGDNSVTAGIKFRTVFGDLKDRTPDEKKNLINAVTTTQKYATATEALNAALGQSLDLQKQLEVGRLTRFKPLSGLKSQILDWKYEDLAAVAKSGPMGDAEKSKLEKAREGVRGLLAEYDKFTSQQSKIDTLTSKVGDSFDSMFDSVLSRQMSFGTALRSGLNSTLQNLAADLIKSQFRSLLTNLFTSAVGGGGFSKSGYGSALPSLGITPYGPPVQVTAAATGIERVKPGTLALLHANETVLSAAEAESYRQNRQAELIAGASSRSSSSGGNITVNYVHNGNVVANSPQEYQKKLQDQARRRGGSQRSLSQQREIAQRFLGLK
ncbi:hypothetical protein EON83_25925 [bacterium]|nr:MAG: hypothetical protein EON83_25925 [bacterium]